MRHRVFVDVGQSGDLPTFRQRLIDFAHELDFGIICGALIADRPGKDPVVVAVGNTPEAFVEARNDVDDAKRDPVLKRLLQLSIPFVYDQALYIADSAGDLWEEQAPFGFHTGIAVALHLSGSRHFILGVDRREPLPRDDEKLTRMLADLQLLAVHAQDAAVRLLSSKPTHLADDVRLTAREAEILKWTMEGKSAWAVGEILRVSEHTVNFHMRNILRKLNASSKHQAVLKAISLGML
jgi:DNA-binding CsgD family transcriptional regulator